MVWSAPFRGPASPERPFIISSRASAETAALQKRWTAFQLPDRVRFNSWESQRSVIEPSVAFLVKPVRSRPASLATTLDVPAVRRLCRPMIGSCHERFSTPTKKARKWRPKGPRLWISPALATSGFGAAFL
ncbi:hypothetical protein Sala_0468 [Sphingopyxis alaskensis RB2256]|uniref:Uncharacterized protein n=1 Tax=Sphingopyxis alaskensis (strain DSM 13593 / LMG 18877 / RB2256) TaxID=317655 RepID=Q1GVY3_SPHAL|nr:hypothetical protein Sala_0468 [Sphingopyxis alaskensis RB2256]